MDNNDIFNLKNINDISASCKKNLKLNGLHDDTKKLLDLFNIKQPLSIDEMIVALYRKFKIEKTRTWVSGTLYNLSRKKLITRLINGNYEKAKEHK